MKIRFTEIIFRNQEIKMHMKNQSSGSGLSRAMLAIVAGLACLTAQAAATPKIQFETLLHDFGSVSNVQTVSASFKFKNTGTDVLKVQPPSPSCGCTVAELKRDSLKPGEESELGFTLTLGNYRTTMEKHITVQSNDPVTPVVSLLIKATYIPAYDVSPMALTPNLPLGVDTTNVFAEIVRTDGKPLQITKLVGSQSWITAQLDPEPKAGASKARVRVEVHRFGPPRRFNEIVHIYAGSDTNIPVSSVFLYGQMAGEISVAPEALYWNLSAPELSGADRPESAATRRISVAAAGGALEIRNLKSSLKGLDLALSPKPGGREYEIVATLKERPAGTVSGNVSFDTSNEIQPKVELPVIINVPK